MDSSNGFFEKINIRYTVLCILFFLSTLLSANTQVPVGTILFVHGEVTIISATDETRIAVRGEGVFEGDRIVSAAASSMQIKMVDSGYLAIRPSTEIRIDKYRFEQTEEDGAETSLIKGGLRSITGTIGKTKKESFKLRTPVATIGIRGTDLEVYYVPTDRQRVLAQGAYLRINSGKGYLQNYAGVQFVSPNQTGFVADKRSAPKLVQLPIDFFNQPDFDLLPDEPIETSENEGGNGSGERAGNSQKGDPSNEDDATFVKAGAAIPSDDEAEFVDLDLPPDLQESWDSEFQPEEEPTFEVTEIDLGTFSSVTSSDVVASQSGVYSYTPTSLGVSDGTLSEATIVNFEVDFDSGTVAYDLYLDFTSPIGPAAVSGASGGIWIFSGSGALASFIGESGLTLTGDFINTGDNPSVVPNASGIWYGFFTGDNADGMFSAFELWTDLYSVSGYTETTQRLENATISGPFSLVAYENGYASLYDTSVSTGAILGIDSSSGALKYIDDTSYSGEYLTALGGWATSTAYSNNKVVWGYWTGYSSDNPDGVFQMPDSTLYYVYSDSDLITDLSTIQFDRMHAKFNLLGASAFNAAGNVMTFDSASSFLLVDFNSGVMNGEFVMSGSDSDGLPEKWVVYTDGMSLNNISSGMGSTVLYAEIYGSGGEQVDSASGNWDFAWSGANGDLVSGGFNLEGSLYIDNSSTPFYSTEGVLVFAGDLPVAAYEDKVSYGLVSMGLYDSFVSQPYSQIRELNSTRSEDSGIYFDSSDHLIGYYSDNSAVSIDPSTTVFSGSGISDSTIGISSYTDETGVEVGKISWGRWAATTDQSILSGDGEGINNVTMLHYIMADVLTDDNALGLLNTNNIVATYSMIGGTAPSLIASDGTLSSGQLNSLNLDVDFGASTVYADMSLTINSDTITASGDGDLSTFTYGGINMTAYQVETSIGSGYLLGQFVGANAEGAIVSYELSTSIGQINGVGALQQTSAESMTGQP